MSRVMRDVHICNNCGVREAMIDEAVEHVSERRVCLHYDRAAPIMFVTEDEPGYVPIGTPPEERFGDEYCEAWNTAIGLTPEQVTEIMASSMFGRWANF